MTYKDQLHRPVQIDKTPKRIVSLVPSQTELLVDLGLKDSIVGVTKFCVHPKQLRKEKTVVGGTKNIKVDKIKALHPDIILCNKEENSLEIIESLKTVAPIHISDIYSLDDAYELIEMYGDIFEVDQKASVLIQDIKFEHKNYLSTNQSSKRQKVAYFIWRKPWMVAANNTYINTMLNEINCINVFQDVSRYPEINLDDPILKEVKTIMLSSEPYPFKEKHIKELNEKLPHANILLVDGEMFSWYGSRLRYAFQYFETLQKK